MTAINDVKFENGVFSIKISQKNYKSELKKDDIQKLEKNIEYFANTMYNSCKNFNIQKFMKTISTTKFIHINNPVEEENGTIRDGGYDSVTNTLEYSSKTSLFHELLHVASLGNRYGKIVRGGLSFDTNETKSIIGASLDEGLTELLRIRYLQPNDTSRYYFESKMVKHIEYLIGRDKLEKIYFNADYMELFLELTKYESVENTLLFIDALDDFSESRILNSWDERTIEELKDCKNQFEFIYKYITRAYCNKVKMENIDLDELNKTLGDRIWVITGLVNVSTDRGNRVKKIHFTTDKRFNKFVNKLQQIVHKKGINQ